MAYQQAIILSAVGNTIKIAHPTLPDDPKTYLTASVSAGGTTLTVLDNTGTSTIGVGISDNDYLIVGRLGSDRTEIVQVNGVVTDGTSITISALIFDHPIDTPIQKIIWNRVNILGAATDGGSLSAVASNINLHVERSETTYIVTGTTYAYYVARYVNQETSDVSTDSDYTLATGYPINSVRSVKDEALSIVNEKVTDISNDFLNSQILNCDREVWAERRHWSWAYTFDSIIGNTEEGGYSVALPSNISDSDSNKSILMVRIEKRPNLQYLTKEEWDRRYINVAHTTLNGAVAVADTTITLTDSSDFDLSGSIDIVGTSVTATITGTIDPAASTTVTGVGTLFTTEVHVGDYLVVTGETRRVTAIASATSLTIAAAFTDGANDVSPDVIHRHSDSVAYTDNIKSSNLLAGVTGIQHGGHATGTHVWQGATFGQPAGYTIIDGTLYFDKPVSSEYADTNIYLSYYRTPTAVNSDSDTVNIPDVTLYHYYLGWKILLKKNNGSNTPESEQMRQFYEMRKKILVSRERTGQRNRLGPRINTIRYEGDGIEIVASSPVT